MDYMLAGLGWIVLCSVGIVGIALLDHRFRKRATQLQQRRWELED